MKTRLHGRPVWGRVVVAGALAVSALMLAPQASYAASRALSLAVVSRDYSFEGLPGRLPAGEYNLSHYNFGAEPHVLIAVNLGPVCSNTITTTEQAQEFLENVQSDEQFEAECPGGSIAGDVFAPPGGRSSGPITLTPGRTLYFCPIPTEEGIPHDDLGMIGFIDVFSFPFIDGFSFPFIDSFSFPFGAGF